MEIKFLKIAKNYVSIDQIVKIDVDYSATQMTIRTTCQSDPLIRVHSSNTSKEEFDTLIASLDLLCANTQIEML